MQEYGMCKMWLLEPVTSPGGSRSGRQASAPNETAQGLHTYPSTGSGLCP